jgi:hypothetical protein
MMCKSSIDEMGRKGIMNCPVYEVGRNTATP